MKFGQQIFETEITLPLLTTPTITPHHIRSLKPNPTISHDHRQRKIQKPQLRLPRTRPNPTFVGLPITRLNSKSLPIGLEKPLRPTRRNIVIGKRERLPSTLSSLTILILATNTNIKPSLHRLAFLLRCHHLSIKAACLPMTIFSCSACRTVFRFFLTAGNHRHHKRHLCMFQIRNDADTVKTAV